MVSILNRLKAFYEKRKHSHALAFLAVGSFLESFISPIPVEFFLVPLCIQKTSKVLFYAMWTTFFSVLGSLVGYFVGAFLTDGLLGFLGEMGYSHYFAGGVIFYSKYGNLAYFLAAFTPIPFKIFTLLSGMFDMSLVVFIVLGTLGRGLRFVLVAYAAMYFGRSFYKRFEKKFWWAMLGLLLFFYFLYKLI